MGGAGLRQKEAARWGRHRGVSRLRGALFGATLIRDVDMCAFLHTLLRGPSGVPEGVAVSRRLPFLA